MKISLAMIVRDRTPICVMRGESALIHAYYHKQTKRGAVRWHMPVLPLGEAATQAEEKLAFENLARKIANFGFSAYTEYVENCKELWRVSAHAVWAGGAVESLCRITPDRGIEILDPENKFAARLFELI